MVEYIVENALVLVPVLALEEEELDVLEKTSITELLIIKKY